MKKKAFIPVLCLPTFQVHFFWSADSVQNQIFYMLLPYKLYKYFNLTFKKIRSLLSSMTAKICFKMLIKSLVDHFQSTETWTEFLIGDVITHKGFSRGQMKVLTAKSMANLFGQRSSTAWYRQLQASLRKKCYHSCIDLQFWLRSRGNKRF